MPEQEPPSGRQAEKHHGEQRGGLAERLDGKDFLLRVINLLCDLRERQQPFGLRALPRGVKAPID